MKLLAIFLLITLVACAQASYNASCVTEKTFTVSGDSMKGIFDNGEEITGLMNYTACNNLTRNEIVIVSWAGNEDPLIKQLKGMPGDHWRLENNKIIINNETLTNSEGIEYQITNRGVRMLSLYTNDYPIIENNTYLILGNDPSGSLDAARFGLMSTESIIGVVK